MKQPPSDKPCDEVVVEKKSQEIVIETKKDIPDELLYPATDRDMVVFFFASDIDYYRTVKKPGYRTVFYFEKLLIESALQIWRSAAPIMMDARKIFAAERIFNSIIHDNA